MSRPISERDVRIVSGSLRTAERELELLKLPDHEMTQAANVEQELKTTLTLLDSISAAPIANDHEFLAGLYHCNHCVEQAFAFAKKFQQYPPIQSPFKFPPIGFGPRRLMFIALNPRFSGNFGHHLEVMSSLDRFKALSRNEVFGGAYIRPLSNIAKQDHEVFYDDQQQIAATAFPNQPFALAACSAEMYFCASAKNDGLCDDSPCARLYLKRLIEHYIRPDVIVTFGKHVPCFFEKYLIGITAKVIHLPFRSQNRDYRAALAIAVPWAASAADALIHNRQPPSKNWTWPGGDNGRPDAIMDYSKPVTVSHRCRRVATIL